MNVLAKTKEVKSTVLRKVTVASIATVSALNMMALSAFADEGGSGVDISAVTSAMTSSLTDLVSKVAIGCAAVVGVGLTIFGIKWCVRTVKSFFGRIAG